MEKFPTPALIPESSFEHSPKIESDKEKPGISTEFVIAPQSAPEQEARIEVAKQKVIEMFHGGKLVGPGIEQTPSIEIGKQKVIDMFRMKGREDLETEELFVQWMDQQEAYVHLHNSFKT